MEMATHSSTRLENPMDGAAWWAIVNGVAENQTQLSNFTFTHLDFSQSSLPILLSA